MLPDSPLNWREMRMQLDCHPHWSYCRQNRWKERKGGEVYFWREMSLFRVNERCLHRHLTSHQMIERWRLSSVIGCVTARLFARPDSIRLSGSKDELQMKFTSGRNKVPPPLRSLHSPKEERYRKIKALVTKVRLHFEWSSRFTTGTYCSVLVADSLSA